MANFDLFYNRIFKWEDGTGSGYGNDPDDVGNYDSHGKLIGTKHGVAAKTLETWLGRDITVADMMALTKATAMEIMKKWFWDKMDADNNQAIAEFCVNWYWGSGFGTAAAWINGVLHKYFGYPFDSYSWTNTVARLNAVDQGKLYDHLYAENVIFYNQLATNNPLLNKYLQGWLNRIKDFYTANQHYIIEAGAGGAAIVALSFGVFF